MRYGTHAGSRSIHIPAASAGRGDKSTYSVGIDIGSRAYAPRQKACPRWSSNAQCSVIRRHTSRRQRLAAAERAVTSCRRRVSYSTLVLQSTAYGYWRTALRK
ncbi:hypothetical protein NPIL_110971 [Nephila pilipes]|uniref:Uncharacterized protein n=1 Tax=Nephila pilipes TaxID=299642 RepID=A0A8X6TPG7_NEPPI|nr:hypothetical protein NPIL_110971 [Nephila pilipes]